MKNKIFKLVSFPQFLMLIVVYHILKLVVQKQKGCVIGVTEIAKSIYHYGHLFKNSKTVCLDSNKYYILKYNYSIVKLQGRFGYLLYGLKRIIYGPFLLAYLACRHDVFIYFWSSGFLLDREYEFQFLKKKNKKIITIFNGDDIRSPSTLREKLNELEYDGFLDYVGMAIPYYLSKGYEKKKKHIAALSDKYADLCFSCSIDQASYLTSKQYFPPYAYDIKSFNRNDDKFDKNQTIKILHAPSHPLVKGTPLVRAAIKKLKLDGYRFEYKELIGESNTKVLKELGSSHIVLNQFYAFAPGLFGIESLANHTAVLMSADPDIETGLPQDAKGAWMITKYWQVYDNLKFLLDNPEEIKKYADTGYDFALNHYTYEKTSEYLHQVFKENGIEV
jgi:hypothetical protein